MKRVNIICNTENGYIVSAGNEFGEIYHLFSYTDVYVDSYCFYMEALKNLNQL